MLIINFHHHAHGDNAVSKSTVNLSFNRIQPKPRVPIQGFGQIYNFALQDLPGNPPSSFKEHRKAKNLYLSRYGDRWMDKLKSSTAMLKFCCITNLICFMMNG